MELKRAISAAEEAVQGLGACTVLIMPAYEDSSFSYVWSSHCSTFWYQSAGLCFMSTARYEQQLSMEIRPDLNREDRISKPGPQQHRGNVFPVIQRSLLSVTQLFRSCLSTAGMRKTENDKSNSADVQRITWNSTLLYDVAGQSLYWLAVIVSIDKYLFHSELFQEIYGNVSYLSSFTRNKSLQQHRDLDLRKKKFLTVNICYSLSYWYNQVWFAEMTCHVLSAVMCHKASLFYFSAFKKTKILMSIQSLIKCRTLWNPGSQLWHGVVWIMLKRLCHIYFCFLFFLLQDSVWVC